MQRMFFTQAMKEGLREEMARDSSVVVIGEDVELGVYGYTSGLLQEFGPRRVRNTPIAELTTTGMTLGAAISGLRPVADFMMGNFLYTGMDQFANQVAKLRYMTGGQFDVPAVFVSTYGAGNRVAAQHSDTPYPVFMNLAGIKIVVPSTPAEAKGLFKAAIRDDNPVLFLVPVMLVGMKGEVPEGEHLLEIGTADVKRRGDDVTLVAIGAMVKEALSAAQTLEGEGISAEVLDPRTLLPMDVDAILSSVARTGRLVVVDEARELCSVASEIAATVAERGFEHLKAPVRRVAAPNVPIPFSPPLEDFVLPNAAKIADAVRQVMAY